MSLLLLFGPGASGAGTGCTAITTTGTGGYPVVVGREYVAVADFKAATVARNVDVGIKWYNAAGTFLSTTTGAVFLDNTTSFVQTVCYGVAPASAAFASVYVEIIGASAAEKHYVDRIGILEPDLWRLPD